MKLDKEYAVDVSIYEKIQKEYGFHNLYTSFYVYFIIAHSTGIEGAILTVDDVKNLLENNIIKGRKEDNLMNVNLKEAYDFFLQSSKEKKKISIEYLQSLSSYILKDTGAILKTVLGTMDSSKGDIRICNVQNNLYSYIPHTKIKEKLKAFCEWYNKAINEQNLSTEDKYQLSFKAHYELVMIHPFLDGNGRISRLIMNQMQYSFGLIPSIVYKEDKKEYIDALNITREKEDLTYFSNFKFKSLNKFLTQILEGTRVSF